MTRNDQTEFVERVKAPRKRIVLFLDSAHLVNLEEPLMFQREMIKVLGETIR